MQGIHTVDYEFGTIRRGVCAFVLKSGFAISSSAIQVDIQLFAAFVDIIKREIKGLACTG